MVKNLPANAGDTGLIPGPGRSHMLQGNEAPTLQLLRMHAAATEACRPRAWLHSVTEATTTGKPEKPEHHKEE